MIEEAFVKTHLIVKDIHDEYTIKWCGSLMDSNPILQDGRPLFVLIGRAGRKELYTIDIKQLEDSAKHMTEPHGRGAVSSDVVRIYIKEVNGNEKPIGSLIHRRIKTYAPMYDKVGYIK